MSGWAVFGIVLAVFVLIGCIPVGVDASYRENGLALRLKIGLFKLQVLPAKEKKKKPKPKAKKPAANKPDANAGKPKKQGSMPKLTLSDILALADLACDHAGKSAAQAPRGGAGAACDAGRFGPCEGGNAVWKGLGGAGRADAEARAAFCDKKA